MFKWLKNKVKDYQNKRKIKKLPIWFRERLTLDRKIKLGERCILSYDFSEQKKRNG